MTDNRVTIEEDETTLINAGETADAADEILSEEEIEPETLTVSAPESIADKYAALQLQIIRSQMDLPISHLEVSLKNKDYLDLSPVYQRRHRWRPSQRSRLIESILLNIPIPPVFLYENEYNKYEVMDGLQRLESIRDFLENGFRLSGLEYWKELNGSLFKDLPDVLKRGLFRRTITAVVLLAETKHLTQGGLDIKKALFERLNSGGTRLNSQELRNARFPGLFSKMLARAARHDLFCEVWDIPKQSPDEYSRPPKDLSRNALYQKMADCQLVLRFFAIKEFYLGDRRGSLGKILDDCMKQHQSDSENEIASLESEFIASLSGLVAMLGHGAFNIPNKRGPSAPLYDALMVAYSLHLQGGQPLADPADARKRLKSSIENRDNYETITARKNTAQSIVDRVDLAQSILEG